jgi:hypothetical protein
MAVVVFEVPPFWQTRDKTFIWNLLVGDYPSILLDMRLIHEVRQQLAVVAG